MSEKLFVGFNFTPLAERKPFVLAEPTIGEPIVIPSGTVIKRVEPIVLPDLEVIEDLPQIEPSFNWDFDQVLGNFYRTLGEMESHFGINLETEERQIILVPSDELVPTDERQRTRLASAYGPYILDGIAGDCRRLNDGGFILRIGYKGNESRVTDERALDVLAHEFGHSLGDDLKDPVMEELKAYAFKSLFIRFYYGVDMFWDDFENLSPEKTHHIARHKLEQLLAAGNCEEEILAELTGKPFGQYQPTDYLKHLKV